VCVGVLYVSTCWSVAGLGQVENCQHIVVNYRTHVLLGGVLRVLLVVIAHNGIATRSRTNRH